MFPSLVAVVVLTAFVVAVALYVKRRARLAPLMKIPGPPPNFFLGNSAWVIKVYLNNSMSDASQHVLEHIMAFNALYGKAGFYVFWLGNSPVISILNPELLGLILGSSVSLEKSFEYAFMHKWLGRGLLTSTGSKWKSRRKLLTSCFHFRILEDFLSVFNEQSMALVEKFRSTADEEYVDITPIITLCTLDTVCETMMGVSIGAQKGENSEYVQAVHNLGVFFNYRTAYPWLWSDLLFNLTSTGRTFSKDIDIVHNFTKRVIKEKKQSYRCQNDNESDEFGTKKRRALMDLLLDLHMREQQITEDDIREEVDTFMFEGHDTTAMAVTFALYCIGLYSDVQDRITEELNSIFDGDMSRPITMDDTRHMRYLERVLQESRRLYPPVPIIGRLINEDIEFQGKRIPKGTTLHVCMVNLHRNPEAFPNPEVFDPDRFLPETVRNRHPYAYLPFSAGPRNCIGQKFAVMETIVMVSNVLRSFRITSLDPRDKVLLKMEFTLKPALPLRMKFTPRS